MDCCNCEDESSVSPCLKYTVFFFNFLFWLVSIAIVVVGIYTFTEKGAFDNKEAKTIYDLVFDISIVMIVLGGIIFILAFTACLGALRENICFLKFFSIVMAVIFVVELVSTILAFVFSTWIQDKITVVLKEELLIRYRDDQDLEGFVNWVQKSFQCCGVGYKGYRDWSRNLYFNCTLNPADNISPERCAVPFSCCIKPDEIEIVEAGKKIFTSGCVEAMFSKAKSNLFLVGGVAVGVAVLQLLGIIFSWVLAAQIKDQKAQWI